LDLRMRAGRSKPLRSPAPVHALCRPRVRSVAQTAVAHRATYPLYPLARPGACRGLRSHGQPLFPSGAHAAIAGSPAWDEPGQPPGCAPPRGRGGEVCCSSGVVASSPTANASLRSVPALPAPTFTLYVQWGVVQSSSSHSTGAGKFMAICFVTCVFLSHWLRRVIMARQSGLRRVSTGLVLQGRVSCLSGELLICSAAVIIVCCREGRFGFYGFEYRDG